jgi:hypothetical protein
MTLARDERPAPGPDRPPERTAADRLPAAWLDARRAAKGLALAIGVLTVLSLAEQSVIHLLGMDHLEDLLIALDLDAEGNIPTWFASATLLAAAGLAAWIGSLTRARGGRDPGHWRALAALLAAASVDEVAKLHEHLGRLQPLLDTHGPVYFAWVIPGSLVTVGLVLLFARFHHRLPVRTRRGLALATALYFTGALVVEALGGWRAEIMGMNNMTHSLIATVEEVLELAGVAVLIVTLLEHRAALAADEDERPRLAA